MAAFVKRPGRLGLILVAFSTLGMAFSLLGGSTDTCMFACSAYCFCVSEDGHEMLFAVYLYFGRWEYFLTRWGESQRFTAGDCSVLPL